MSDGIIWSGVAALTYEAYQRSLGQEEAARPDGYSAPSWEDLTEVEKRAWEAAAREAADVVFRAATA